MNAADYVLGTVGWTIVGFTAGEWHNDWDGIIHPTIEAAEAEIVRCHVHYPHYVIARVTTA